MYARDVPHNSFRLRLRLPFQYDRSSRRVLTLTYRSDDDDLAEAAALSTGEYKFS